MFTQLKQWWCGHTSKYHNGVGPKGHREGRREKLVGARYRIKCLDCDKVLYEDTNLDKSYDRR